MAADSIRSFAQSLICSFESANERIGESAKYNVAKLMQ